MNKTIHELEELTRAEATDELIVYDVSDAKSKKVKVQNLCSPDVISITKTTGTGGSVGALIIPRTEYPDYERIIPFGLDNTQAYSIELWNIDTSNFTFFVYNRVNGNWADNVSVTFRAFAYPV